MRRLLLRGWLGALLLVALSVGAVAVAADGTFTPAGDATLTAGGLQLRSVPGGFGAPVYTPSAPPSGGLVGPPTSREQCKHGGWQQFTNPSFRNQGQCVSYVNHQGSQGNGDDQGDGNGDDQGDDNGGDQGNGHQHGDGNDGGNP